MNYNKNYEEETTLLIEDAKRKLEEVNSESKGKHKDIESESKGKKKKIIQDSAAALEGRLREDTIAMVLVHGLKGVVSERSIHQCLPEKYKQKYRVNNAKKQNKKVDGKLAKASWTKAVKDEDDDDEEGK